MPKKCDATSSFPPSIPSFRGPRAIDGWIAGGGRRVVVEAGPAMVVPQVALLTANQQVRHLKLVVYSTIAFLALGNLALSWKFVKQPGHLFEGSAFTDAMIALGFGLGMASLVLVMRAWNRLYATLQRLIVPTT